MDRTNGGLDILLSSASTTHQPGFGDEEICSSNSEGSDHGTRTLTGRFTNGLFMAMSLQEYLPAHFVHDLKVGARVNGFEAIVGGCEVTCSYRGSSGSRSCSGGFVHVKSPCYTRVSTAMFAKGMKRFSLAEHPYWGARRNCFYGDPQ